MSKNLTRKGLALGAVVALGASFFAGTPAFAAGELVLAPNAGTTNSVFATDTFTLNASLAAGQVATNISQLKYKITNNTALPVAYTATGGTGTTGTVTVAEGNETANPGAAVGSNTLALSLNGDSTTATSTVTVLAFIDSNSNGTADSGEYQTTQTVTFVKPSEVTATTKLTAPQVGDSKLVAHVTLDKSINIQQIGANDVTVSFAKNGTAIASTNDTAAAASGTGFDLNGAVVASARKNNVSASYDSTASDLKATFYPDSNTGEANNVYTAVLASAGIYSAQASIATVASGSASTSTVVAPTLKSYTIKATASADAKNVTTATETDVTNGTGRTNGAATIRSGAYGATVVANFMDNATTAAAVSGQSAIVTVTPSSSVITSDAVTVNGTAVGDGAGTAVTLPALTTDAAGNVTLTIAGAATDNNDTLTIAVKVEGYTTANYVVTFADTAFTVVNNASVAASGESVAVAGTKVVNYSVADQFGTAPSGDYRLNVVRSVSGSARTTAASWNYVASLASGKASVSIVDNGAGVGADTVTATLQKAVTGGGYADVAGATADSFVLSYVASVTPSAVTVAATNDGSVTALALEAKDFVSADTRFQNVTIPSYTPVTHVYGVVTDVTGAALPGVTVTASAAGLLFQSATASSNGAGTAGNTYAVGSLSALTDASGQYEFLVYGHSSGAQTVTITSGAAVKTQKLTFATATAAAVALALPSVTQTGRAVDAVATVTDKFGNAIAGSYVKFVATGVGAINGSSTAVVATDAAGKASVKLVIGANETGDAVVIATSVTTSAGDTATTDVAAKTATLTAGVTDAQVDIVANRVSVVASFTKGKTVAFYVDGLKKWSKVSTSDADVVLNYNLKKGTHTVALKVSGGFITTEKFIVK